MYYLKTLGIPRLCRSGEPAETDALAGSKSLVILAILATTPGHRERRDHVAELLWPGSERPRALRALRQALFYLSQHTDVIERDEETIALATDRLAVDLWDFDAALKDGDYGRAIDLYGGRFLQGFERKAGTELEHWIEAETSRIHAGLEVAYGKEIARLEQAGRADDAIQLARLYAQLNPLDHRGQWALLRSLLGAGDDVGALRAYEAYRTLISRELGEEPPDEVRDSMNRMREELLSAAGPSLGRDQWHAPSDLRLGPGTEPRQQGWLRRHRAILVGAAALVVLVVAVAVVFTAPGGIPPRAPLLEGESRLLVTLGRGSRPELAEVRIRGSGVEVGSAGGLGPNDLPSPDGRLVAFTERAPDGWNLAVRRTGTDEVRTLTQDANDEYPLAWSPDGEQLIYVHSRLLADGRGNSYQLGLYALRTGIADTIPGRDSSTRPSAAWSSDGTRIAFTADSGGRPEVYVADSDGWNVRNVSAHRLSDRDPAWAPDQQRIAFVSDRSGQADLYTVMADGSDLRQVTASAAREASPVWLSPTVLAFVEQRDQDGDLWLVDTFTGEARQVTRNGNVTGLVAVRGASPRWVERVEIRPPLTVVSPGQFVDLEVDAAFAAADRVQAVGLPLRWSAVPDSVARIDQEGRLRIVGRGRATVVGSTAGWRADTLSISSVDVTAVPLEPVFEEDWSSGISAERWLVFGEPSPTTNPSGAPGGYGKLINNGDATFESGAASRVAFPVDRGLTVELDGQMRFTGKLHQVFGIALYGEELNDSALAAGDAVPIVEFRVQGATASEPGRAWIATADTRHILPTPSNVRFWRRYALQILRDGAVELLVDGSVYWRSPYRLPRENLNSLYLALGFQSFETEIAHGPVRVYPEPKHRLPAFELEHEPEPPTPTGAATGPVGGL